MTSRAIGLLLGRRAIENPALSGGRKGRWAMRAGQYSAVLCRPRQGRRGVQDPPRLLDRGGLLEGLADRLVGAEALDVPGVELAQVAPGARPAEVLDGAVHDPLELRSDLVRRGLVAAVAEQLGEQ